MPRNLEEGITNNKVSKYITHVMDELSFGSMGMRKGTIAPALINTCQWLLSSLEYINWRNPDRIHHNHGLMWIKGKAGAGKSTLMKFLIESTRSRHSGDNIISFFFNARGDDMEKSLSGLYRHLLHQLMSSVLRLQHTMMDDINTLASQGWQLQPLKGLFRAAVLGLRSERFTCFIDALDESSEDEIQDLIDFFEELSNDVVARGISFHVCFSSRHYPNVELETCQHLNLDRKAEHENDISLYIKSKLKLPIDGTSNDLIPLMQKKAQGVFLWAVLVTQILNKDYRHGENHKARSRLEKIPPDLHSLFHEMIHRNVEDPNDTRGLASILQWIAFALRPLAPQELYYAVRSEDPDFDFSQLWQTNLVDLETMKLFILNRSKGLVELTTIHRRTIVQFIHESVRDFLNETGFDILMPGRGVPLLGYAHNNLTQCCFRWMHVTSSLREQISRVLSEKHRTRKLVIEQIPLLSYIVEFMIKHADLACTNGVSQENFIETFPTGMWISFAQSVSDGYISRVLSHGGRSELDPQRSMPPLLREVLMYYRAHALFEIERQRKRTLQKPFTQRDFSTIRFSPKKSLLPEESNDDFEFLLHIGSPSHTAMERQITTLMAVVDRRKARILQLMQTPRVATSSSCPPKAD
jgi:dephospho-CoA kinase